MHGPGVQLPHHERRVAVALGALALLVASLHAASRYAPYTWINRDGRFYTNMNVTLVESASLEQSEFAASWYNGKLGWNYNLPASFSNIALGRHGEHWPMHPYLMPLASTPLFFAFGLIGTLLFNLAMFGVIAACGYRFCRDYATPSAAAVAVGLMLLSTSVFSYAYDYLVDVFLLALLSGGVASLIRGHGATAGALVAMTWVIKPTTALLLPALLLLVAERKQWRVAARAVAGGAPVLLVAAAVNTYLFGRPWWFGYNRVLIVVAGERMLESDVDAFTTPLRQGLERLWSGYWGLRHRMTVMALAVPGLLALVIRRHWYGIGALVTAAGSVLLFAKYKYEGDRFLWPAAFLLLPAMAYSVELISNALQQVTKPLRRGFRGKVRGPVAAAVAVVAAACASLAVGAPVEQRLPQSAYTAGSLAWADGSLDLRETLPSNYLERTTGESSIVAQSRFGHWIPRTSPAALAVSAPWAAAAGRQGLVLLHLLCAAACAFALTRLLHWTVPEAVAAAGSSALFLFSPLRDAAIEGGPRLIAAAAALLSLWLARQRRWALAGALSVAAAWIADAPWLIAVAVGWLAWPHGRAARTRMGVSVAVGMLLWGMTHLVWLGRPFASPDQFVPLQLGGPEPVLVATSSPYWLSVVAEGPWLAPLALLTAVALVGQLVWMRGERRLAGAWLLVMAGMLLPGGVEQASREPLLWLAWMAPALVALPAIAHAPWSWYERNPAPRRVLSVVAIALAGLVLMGAVRRGMVATEPFRIASSEAVRNANVRLGSVPCDFLAWEHLSWECSHLDRGLFNETGLVLPDGVHIGGERYELFLIPTGMHRQTRSVRWEDVPARKRLELAYATPDNLPGQVDVRVRINGRTVDTFQTLPPGSGVQRRSIDTRSFSGKDVSLSIEVEPLRRGGAAVALDGGWDWKGQLRRQTAPSAGL